jgi:excisionase family DNA binding protein
MSSTTTTDAPPVRWLSVPEAAARLDVSPATIRRWVRDGHIRGVQPAGPHGVVRIRETDLEERPAR